jgi:hypothetical protein
MCPEQVRGIAVRAAVGRTEACAVAKVCLVLSGKVPTPLEEGG